MFLLMHERVRTHAHTAHSVLVGTNCVLIETNFDPLSVVRYGIFYEFRTTPFKKKGYAHVFAARQ